MGLKVQVRGSSVVERLAHNQDVPGSIPGPANPPKEMVFCLTPIQTSNVKRPVSQHGRSAVAWSSFSGASRHGHAPTVTDRTHPGSWTSTTSGGQNRGTCQRWPTLARAEQRWLRRQRSAISCAPTAIARERTGASSRSMGKVAQLGEPWVVPLRRWFKSTPYPL